MTTELNLIAVERDADRPFVIAVNDLVIAGWTGRNVEAMEEHIRELEVLGVPRPRATPLFYRVGANLLTTDVQIDVAGNNTSGEVETILFSTEEGLWVGLGSDHTDRHAETFEVTIAKQACPKPVAEGVWRYTDVSPHWDELVLRSFAWIEGTRVLYQEGAVSALRPAEELARMYTGTDELLAPGTAMYCGTLAVRGGVAPATQFELELDDPVLGRQLRHQYLIRALPVAD
jgi:hypothetical protein